MNKIVSVMVLKLCLLGTIYQILSFQLLRQD